MKQQQQQLLPVIKKSNRWLLKFFLNRFNESIVWLFPFKEPMAVGNE